MIYRVARLYRMQRAVTNGCSSTSTYLRGAGSNDRWLRAAWHSRNRPYWFRYYGSEAGSAYHVRVFVLARTGHTYADERGHRGRVGCSRWRCNHGPHAAPMFTEVGV